MSMYSAGIRAYDAPLDERLALIRRTYLHLTAAVIVFVALSAGFYTMGVGRAVLEMAVAGGRFGWLMILGGFVLAGWLASSMARSGAGTATQYAGLALYTLAEALIFSPLIYIAAHLAPGAISTAAGITILTFGGLSFYVLTTRQDFSYLRTGLCVASLVALGVIVAGALFGFGLGVWFSGAMILLACGSIVYSTSRVLHQYRTDQHVAAALELFAALALLFWYVLRLLMQLQRR